MAVADAKLGAGQPGRHVGMHLGVNIRVNPDQDARRSVNCLGGRSDVFQVKLGVHVYERALLNRKPELLWQLAIAIEDRPTTKYTLLSLEAFDTP